MSEITQELSLLSAKWQLIYSQVGAPVSGAAAQLVQANPLRWGLTFGVQVAVGATGGVYLSTLPFNRSSNLFGFVLQLGIPLVLNYRDHPALVQSAWYASAWSQQIVPVAIWQEVAIQ